MDPLSLTGTLIAIIQLFGAIIKLGKKHIGPSKHTPALLAAYLQELHVFSHALTNLRAYLDISSLGQITTYTVLYLDRSLENCTAVLNLLQELQSRKSFFKRFLTARQFDNKINGAMDTLRHEQSLFSIMLLVDQG